MELPDCPPGAEGYQDSVTEVPKKLEVDNAGTTCTKAEQEFQQHLSSLKIQLEDGSSRCMVERHERDVSGKWIYFCCPCAAKCSGETVLQNHISGKKHKAKISSKTVWPLSIFERNDTISRATDKSLKKPGQDVEILREGSPSELDLKYGKYREVPCHIQETLDNVKTPLIGVEYLVEHPPEKAHHEPSYICTLCFKQGYPRTIVNHLACFWHRYNYLLRHFRTASTQLTPYRLQTQYREGVAIIVSRLAKRIDDVFGRLKPINIDKEEYERDKNLIHQWIFKGYHINETEDCNFVEIVDVDLINSLDSSLKRKKLNPSPPVVSAPSRPYNSRRAPAQDALSVSDEPDEVRHPRDKVCRKKSDSKRYEPYPEKRCDAYKSRFHVRYTSNSGNPHDKSETIRRPNYQYKHKLALDQCSSAEELARKALAYHEKNPEKHPLYPDEWKKFWNRRYKEIQAEGKDPSKHDFKPEWILFWTTRLKELHEEELRTAITEVYRRLRLTPPDRIETKNSSERRNSAERRRSRPPRKPSPEPRRREPPREARRTSPDYRDRRPPVRRSSPKRRSPLRLLRTRSRSPILKFESRCDGSGRRGRSPLSRRDSAPRNHSPSRPLLDTVLISDEELKPDDGLSPWNSDDSLGSLPDVRSPIAHSSRTGSVGSRASRRPEYQPQDFGAAENMVATLRLLVALEDYLGSLGPKIVDLLAEALKMEKEKANSSEELLETDSAVVLIETAKEKLKGAVQAGLVTGSAAAAVRTAVVRAAATLHEADNRLEKKKKEASKSAGLAVPVLGVGAVDREQIAQQMAAALIAQGKTDVSSEELAQLVDAVIGMAEAKKREAESKKIVEARGVSDKSIRGHTATTASALQLLQSAYDDKKVEKEDVPDAMDGLSDSDLETLLKNFNELSAEEQHSLIAYLKKLEAREPQRVERLRKYVGAAATNPPPVEEKPTPFSIKPVDIESDDDDYTVEDVFKSATQKVKEDQIRQEMEIVKKSLEESKELPKLFEPMKSTTGDIQKNMFSATDLLALVQASLQSTPAVTPAQTADVVSSTTQPRSFGDLPEPMMEPPKPIIQNTQLFNNQLLVNPGLLGISPNIPNFGGNRNNLNEALSIPVWESRLDEANMKHMDNQSNTFNQDTRPHDDYNQIPPNQSGYDQNQRGQENYNQPPRIHQGIFNQGSRDPQDNFNQDSRGPPNNYNQGLAYNQGPRNFQDNFSQGSRGSEDNFNQGRDSEDNCKPGQRGPQDKFNQGQRGSQDDFNQGERGSQDNFNQVQRGSQDNFNQGPLGLLDNFGQGQRDSQDNLNQEPRGRQDGFNQGSRGLLDNFNHGQRNTQDNFNQGLRGGPQDNFNQGQKGTQDNFKQGQRGSTDNFNSAPQNNFNQGSRLPQGIFNHPPPSLMDFFNQGSRNQDQSYGGGRGSHNNFNQAPRGNFMGNRSENFNNRQDGGNSQMFSGQKFGNFDKNNFRGRGRGQGGQNMRGRGRGYY